MLTFLKIEMGLIKIYKINILEFSTINNIGKYNTTNRQISLNTNVDRIYIN